MNFTLKPFAKRQLTTVGLFAALALSPVLAHAGAPWALSASDSKVAYLSIKKDTVGEVNHFKSISGDISDSGEVSVEIDLSSVETNIGIRNERMIKYVFGGDATKATLKAKVDKKALSGLAVGAMKTIKVDGGLYFLDKKLDITTSMVVAKLSEKRLLVMTDDMVVVKTEALGVNKGVDKLMELAALPGITRVVPVSLRMVFDKQ